MIITKRQNEMHSIKCSVHVFSSAFFSVTHKTIQEKMMCRKTKLWSKRLCPIMPIIITNVIIVFGLAIRHSKAHSMLDATLLFESFFQHLHIYYRLHSLACARLYKHVYAIVFYRFVVCVCVAQFLSIPLMHSQYRATSNKSR